MKVFSSQSNELGNKYVEWYHNCEVWSHVPPCSVARKRYCTMCALCTVEKWPGAASLMAHHHTKRSPGRDNCCWKVVKFWYQAEERRWTTIAFWRLTMKLFPSSTSASSRQAAGEMVRDCWAKFWKQEGWWSDIEKLILITLMLTLIGVAMLLISAMTLQWF